MKICDRSRFKKYIIVAGVVLLVCLGIYSLLFYIFFVRQRVTLYDNIIIKGNVKYDIVDVVHDYYDEIPFSLQKCFSDSGWKMIVVHGYIHFDGFSLKKSYAVGKIDYDAKLLYISDLEPEALVHEFGHYFDYISGWCSDEFPAQVYADEQLNFLQLESTAVDNYSSISEYFAESFSLFVLQHDSFSNVCPGTCAFIQGRLSTLD